MNQHYVPRVYLKNFSQKRKKDFMIDVFDKHKQSYFKTNIKGICTEKELYTLANDTTIAKDVLAIENLYARFIEPIYEKSYKILIDPKVSFINPLQHANILIGVFQLYMRNPKWMYDSIEKHRILIRQQLKDANSNNKQSINYLGEEFNLNDKSEETIVDFAKSKVIKIFKEEHLTGTKEICEFHADAKFEICHLVDNSIFITCDNPLVSKDMINDNPHPLLRSKEFIIPLNPKIGLRIHHDNRKQPYKIYRYSGKNGTAHTFNDKVIENSSRFILGTKESIEQHFKLNESFEIATDDLHKRIEIYKQVIEVAKIYDHGKETARLLTQCIEKYEKGGNISKDEEQKMYREIQKEVHKFTKGIIAKKK
jgi:hypothetical protein